LAQFMSGEDTDSGSASSSADFTKEPGASP
jgi:hypothetical protein